MTTTPATLPKTPTDRLFCAAKENDAIAALSALADGADLNARQPFTASKNAKPGHGRWRQVRDDAPLRQMRETSTALSAASAHGSGECVQLLLAKIPEDSLAEQAGEALYVAASAGSRHVVEMILDFCGPGLANERANNKDQLAIFAAVESGHLDCVEILAPLSNLSRRAPRGMSALHVALSRGHAETAILLSRNMEALALSEEEISGEDANLVMAAAEGGNARCVEAALAWAPEGAAAAGDGRTALMWAAASDSPECVELLLPLSCPCHEDYDFNTALHLAAQWGPSCVKLLAPLSNIEATDADDRLTPLLRAISCGHVEAAKDLLAAGASLSAKNHKGQQAMHKALGSSSEMLLFLIKLGLDGKVLDKEKNSPLMTIAAFPEWFLGADAEIKISALLPVSDIDAQNADGQTAADIARTAGNIGVANQINAWRATQEAEALSQQIAPGSARKSPSL